MSPEFAHYLEFSLVSPEFHPRNFIWNYVQNYLPELSSLVLCARTLQDVALSISLDKLMVVAIYIKRFDFGGCDAFD